ncbi:MAG: DUF2235 domain-containing protein [Pseudomonadota bacterium]
MIERLDFSIPPALAAPVAGVNFVEPLRCLSCIDCEMVVNVGLFFDGTKNNIYSDRPVLGHSNIARLYDAYKDKADDGYFSIYIPGVGTPFPEIGEHGNHISGSAFSIGAESRVLFGLLEVFNSVHSSVFVGRDLFDAKQVKALCGYSTLNSADIAVLEALALGSSLIGDGEKHSLRETFLKTCEKDLEKKLRSKGKPVVKMCFIDVFGFSRGAAEARVFCQWFAQLLVDEEFSGIPTRLRFLGIIDTVSSAGYGEGIFGAITNTTGGHGGWAKSEYLIVHPSVRNCLHQVAMHEVRKNFPLDEVRINGVLPKNCQEFAYPGAHSDVGGGYEPEELGVSVGNGAVESDAMKLSQIPLNHMLECAVAAGVPLDIERARQTSHADVFSVAPVIQRAFDDFLALSNMTPRMLCDWMQPYLNWRWQVKDKYVALNHVRRAKLDRDFLLDSNKKFIRDAELMRYRGSVEKASDFLSQVFDKKPFDLKNPEYRQEELSALDPEALAVLQKAQQAEPVPPALAEFFDNFVHDSLAGFRKDLVEVTGYWRYRRGFRGDAAPTIVSVDRADQSSEQT